MNPPPLSSIRCFLLDMDGTFYLGENLLPGALDFINLLKSRGIGYLFLTNNSSKDRRQYVEKLRHLGLTDLPEDRVFTSGEATAIYLSARKPGARLYVVGTPSLEAEFRQRGFVLADQDVATDVCTSDVHTSDVHTSDVSIVVLGFDTTLTYARLWKLCDLVRAGVPYVATHPDINCPTETGFMPDIGSIMALVEASTGRRPDIIIGKPNLPIVEALVERTGLPLEQIAMIGDRLYTDIAMGSAGNTGGAGITTILVLSGETRRQDLAGSPFKPDYVMENLAELVRALS